MLLRLHNVILSELLKSKRCFWFSLSNNDKRYAKCALRALHFLNVVALPLNEFASEKLHTCSVVGGLRFWQAKHRTMIREAIPGCARLILSRQDASAVRCEHYSTQKKKKNWSCSSPWTNEDLPSRLAGGIVESERVFDSRSECVWSRDRRTRNDTDPSKRDFPQIIQIDVIAHGKIGIGIRSLEKSTRFCKCSLAD